MVRIKLCDGSVAMVVDTFESQGCEKVMTSDVHSFFFSVIRSAFRIL